MADVNANIGVHIDTSAALAELKNLQRQLATFHASIAKGSAASAMAQRNLQTNLLNSINATGQFTAQMGLVRTSTESFTHALEKNKLGMKEYFRYAGGATRTFGKLFKQEFDTIQQVAEERVKKMQTQYIKMGRDANGAMKAMAITPNALNMKDFGTQTQIAAQKQALFNQLVRQGSTNLLNFGKNTQWAGRQLMVGFTVPLAYLGTVAAKTFMDLEKQAIRFKRVYGDMFTTTEDTAKAIRDIELLAESFTKYGVAVVDTMEMAANAAAMGKTGADLQAQVAQATRLAILGSVEQEQALETTISLTNAFGVAAEDLTSKIDFLNSVENQTVVSIEDLTIAIPKAGPVVKQLGGDVEDLAFFLTAMKEGGINASEGANALKSGLASLINPSKKASEFLSGLGININAIVEGNQGNIRDTVIGFSQALDTLDPLNRARAIEQLFGKFQFSRLSTLFQNVTKDGTQASRVLQLATSSVEELAILSERELKAVEDAVGTNFKAAVEDLKLTLAPIGKEFLKAVTPIVKVVGDVLEKFNGLSEGTKKFIVIATALVGLIGPTLLMTFGLLANGAANIIKLFLALRVGFMKLGGNSKILAEQTNYMTMEQLEAATVATSLNQAHTRLTQSFTAETVAVKALRQAYVEATIAAANFARSNPGMMIPGAKGIKLGKGNSGQTPKGFSSGTTGLPGPIGAGDIIPILAAPGEAIIPSKVAQDPKFKPIINAMVNGTLQGFIDGTDNVQPFANSPKFQGKVDYSGPSQSVLDTNPSQVSDLLAGRPRTTETNEEFAARSAALAERIARNKEARNAALSAQALPEELPQALPKDSALSAIDDIARTEARSEGFTSTKRLGVDNATAQENIARRNDATSYAEAEARAYEEAVRMRDAGRSTTNLLSSKNVARLGDTPGTIIFNEVEYDASSQKTAESLVQRINDDIAESRLPGGAGEDKAAKTIANRMNNLQARGDKLTKSSVFKHILGGKSVSGGAAANNSEIAKLRKIINKEIPDTETKKLQAALAASGLSEKEQIDFLKKQEAHIMKPQGLSGHTDPAKWQAGQVLDEPAGLNNYLNRAGNSSVGKMINDVMTDPSKARDLGYTPKEVRRLAYDFAFAQTQKHPATFEEFERVARIAQFEVDMHDKGLATIDTVNQARGVVALSETRKPLFYKKINQRLIQLGEESGRPTASRVFKGQVDKLSREQQRQIAASVVINRAEQQRAKAAELSESEIKKLNAEDAGTRAAREAKLETIAAKTKNSPVGNQEPAPYVKQITRSSGYSFSPMPGMAGFYETADGRQVFVKPVMDYQSAVAEQRGTVIARDVHGLESPNQSIQTMIDPTDPTGNRKLIVLESPYDNRFNPTKMTNTFSEDDFFRQFVAASLRGDKDLKKGNLSGNIMADVGPAGVFESASGERGYSTNINSMEQQAKIILGMESGGPGNQSRFFREATANTLADMTPQEFERKVVAEIDRVLPNLEKTVGSFKGLTPQERKVYRAMIDRAKAGQKVSWQALHPSSVLVAKDESFQDKKTKKITKIKGKAKPTNVRPSSGKLKDDKIAVLPDDQEVVKTPKPKAKRVGKTVLPSFASAPDADESAAKARQTRSPGIRIIDAQQQFKAEQNALRRQLEKLGKIKIATAKAEIREQRRVADIQKQIQNMQEKAKKVELQKIKEQQTEADKKARDEKMAKQQTRMMRMQGAGMAAGMVATGAYMTGNVGAGNALMGLSALAMIGPMLANPVGIAVAAITVMGAGMLLLRKAFDDAQDKTMEMTESLGTGSAAIQSLAEFSGNVSAGEIMDKRRAGQLTPYAIQPGKTTFGQSFVKGDRGKAMLSNVGQTIKDNGSEAAQKQVLNQMATSVAAGALSAAQARSIVANLGAELGDYSFAIKVNAELMSILGPNGENLKDDPLEVRLKLMDISQKDLKAQTDVLAKSGPGNISALVRPIISNPLTELLLGDLVPVLQGKKDKEKLGNASGATVSMQKMAIEQAQEMQDSLTIQYEKELAIAKAKGDSVKAATLQTDYEADRLALINKSAILTKNINSTFKNSSFEVKQALNAGVDKQITKVYKGTAEGDIAPLAKDLIKDSSLSREQQYTLKMQVASKQMNPMQIVNLMETFGKDRQTLDNIMKITTKFGGTTGNQTIALVDLFVGKDGKPAVGVQQEFIAKVTAAKTPEEAQKILDFYSAVAATGNVLNTAIVVNTILKDPELAKELMANIDEIKALKGEITLEIARSVVEDDPKALAALNEDLVKFNRLNDEEKKIYLSTLVTTISTVDKNDPAFKTWLGAEGSDYKDAPPGVKLREYVQWNAERLVTGLDKTTAIKSGDADGSGTKKQRDTTLDALLQKLKLTRDASINAEGGIGELRKTLKKVGGDVKVFNGLEQALSKLGATSDFIEFIGGMDNAAQKGFVNIAKLKKGIVELTADGKLAFKGYKEAQLGAFSASSAQAINELRKQRSGFVSLKAAGLASADALEMISDAQFATSLSVAKTSKEIKKLIKDYQALKAAEQTTLKKTSPQEYFNDQMDIAMKDYDVQEELIRRTYEPEIEAIEKLVEANNELIEQKQRLLETSETYGSRAIELINEEIDTLNRSLDIGIDAQLQTLQDESSKLSEHQAIMGHTVDGINKKYDLQEAALERISSLNQEISEEQRSQLEIADAISQGDISAAAKAAQEMRAQSSANAATRAGELINQARELEIAKVLSPDGLTADQISNLQYKNERTSYLLEREREETQKKIVGHQEKIYQIELLRKPVIQSIRDLEDKNYQFLNNSIPAIEKSLDLELKAVEDKRKKWEEAQFQITLANTKTDAYQKSLGAAESVLKKVSTLWGNLTNKNLTITIEQIEAVIGGRNAIDVLADQQREKQAQEQKAAVANSVTGFGQAPSAAEAKAIVEAAKLGTPFGQSESFVDSIGTPFGQSPSAQEVKIAKQVAAWRPGGLSMGGLVPKYFAAGGFARGTDTIPAMLTPGEFVIRKNAVDNIGVNNLNKINNGSAPGNSVYNYSVDINVANSDASSSDIARAVIGQIKYIDSQRIRGQR